MNLLQSFISAILGGIVIALGSAASLILKPDSTLASAVIFSMGFLAVAVFELSIFTDNLGAIFSKNVAKQTKKSLTILFGNILGALPVGIALIPKLNKSADVLVKSKYDISFVELAVGSVLCGMLVYIAMHGFRKSGSGFTGCAILVAASSAISVCGFDYALANIFYIGAAFDKFKSYQNNIGEVLILVLFVSLGNAIGAMIFSLLNELKSEEFEVGRHHHHKHRRHSHHEHKDNETQA